MSDRKLEGQYAGFLTRAIGLFLDYAIIAVIVVAIGLLTTVVLNAFHIDLTACPEDVVFVSLGTWVCRTVRWLLVWFAVILGPLYYVLFWTLTGQTIGQRVMGLRVVRLDGRRVGFISSTLRWIGYQLCALTLGLGFLWVLVDDRRMGWHDKLARTCVIYSWKARQNEGFIDRVNRRLRRNRRAAPAKVAEAGPGVSDAAQAAAVSDEGQADAGRAL